MRGRIFVPCVLLGVIAAFVVWSIAWALQAREERTFGVSDNPAVVDLRSRGLNSEPDRTVARLTDLLARSKAALVVNSDGNGRPGVIVLDPVGIIPWLQGAPGPISAPDSPRVALFAGTYCAREWSAYSTCALVPKSAKITAIVRAPADAESLQFAYSPVPGEGLPTGSYVLSTSDPAVVTEFLNITRTAGMEQGSVVAPPLSEELTRNPLTVMSVFLLLLGSVAAFVHWVIIARRREAELRIRYAGGASPRGLVLEQGRAATLECAAGSTAGAVLSGLLVAAVGQVALPGPVVLWLLVGAVAMTVAATLLVLLAVQRAVASALAEAPHG